MLMQLTPCSLMQCVKLCRFVASPFAVDQLCKKEFFQLFAFAKDGRRGKLWPKEWNIFPGSNCHFVPRVRRARVDCLHDDVGVQEVRGDHVRAERGVRVLKDDGQDVVADVALALQLLFCVQTSSITLLSISSTLNVRVFPTNIVSAAFL